MKIYYFDEETGIFQGEDFVDEDPLKRGACIIPIGATMIAPPFYRSGQSPFFDLKAQCWEVRNLPHPTD